MPIYFCSHAILADTVEALEADGEILVSVAPANVDTVIVATQRKPKLGRPVKGTETR